ncbi:hypothetical protein [Shewanella sp. 6_MG-2023]|uniref:hypothetical protein n=1 Tax=Shewanella sp. 6_MG-2023 TaxID=3062660 RepID=UPI0026E2BE95|nr:hypothetical protein [Shewanella sp. 6_MG-2023]MDO6621010.1 hypothetical protein [Shewanella sp. 6_MG-2023]
MDLEKSLDQADKTINDPNPPRWQKIGKENYNLALNRFSPGHEFKIAPLHKEGFENAAFIVTHITNDKISTVIDYNGEIISVSVAFNDLTCDSKTTPSTGKTSKPVLSSSAGKDSFECVVFLKRTG